MSKGIKICYVNIKRHEPTLTQKYITRIKRINLIIMYIKLTHIPIKMKLICI